MSSGTYVKVGRYYNHYHISSLDELRERKQQATKELEDIWGRVVALAMATPRDITPTDEDPVQYVTERVMGLRTMIEEAEFELQALNDIGEGWYTREED